MAKRTCTLEGCERPYHANGWCQMHDKRWKKDGGVGAIDPVHPRSDGGCSVPLCERPHEAHGLCKMHYERNRRHGEIGEAGSRRFSNTETLCLVETCGDLAYRFNLCNKHALRYVRHGDPLAGGRWRVHGDDVRRYESFVDLVDGCHRWDGELTRQGYGWVRSGSESGPAYRWAWELFVGPIPPGLELDHVCHNRDVTCRGGKSCLHRACVFVGHLEPVTPEENHRRMVEHKRAYRAYMAGRLL